MIPITAWIIATYAACRLLTVPLFLPRREDGRIDTVPFIYVSVVCFAGCVVLAWLSYWMYQGFDAVNKLTAF